MPKSIGIMSIKGGVGKTTIAASLAVDLVNHHSKKVLLLDANFSAPNLGLHMDIVEPQNTIHNAMSNKIHLTSAIHNRFGVDTIPGDYNSNNAFNPLKLRDKLKNLKKEYDFVIIDSSPSLNEELLGAILASDILFIVTTPDFPTLSCSLKAAKLAKQRGRPVAGIIINKITDPSYELSLKDIEKTIEIPVVARIPNEKNNVRSIFTRIPMPIYCKKSKFSREINRLSSALVGVREKRSLFGLFVKDFKKEQVNREILKQSFYRSMFN